MTSSESKPLIVIGSGGHAKVVIDTALAAGRRILFATDSQVSRQGERILEIPIAGDDSLIRSHHPSEIELLNGIGSAGSLALRSKIWLRWLEAGYRFATLVHPRAVVAASASLGAGAQIMAGAVLQPEVVIGDQTIVNTRAVVDHDCRIGNCVHISPGATLCGAITVGDRTHIGAGATIIQGLRIGEDSLIGAGSVVVRPVADAVTVLGVPARPIGRRES